MKKQHKESCHHKDDNDTLPSDIRCRCICTCPIIPENVERTGDTGRIQYYKLDHSCCFESDKPPCGQRIKHFECCLCKELNQLVKEERERIVGIIEAEKGLSRKTKDESLSDLIAKIKG